MHELRLAITAIEQARQPKVDTHSVPEGPARIVRRGELKRALLDCLRCGIGARSALDEALKERGIETSASSISNALNRMKNEIRWDTQKKAYVLRNAEDPAVSPARSSLSNGETGSYPV